MILCSVVRASASPPLREYHGWTATPIDPVGGAEEAFGAGFPGVGVGQRSGARRIAHWSRCCDLVKWTPRLMAPQFQPLVMDTGGPNPNRHSNGDSPVDEFRSVLWAYSTQTRNFLQLLAWLETKQRRNFSSSWLARSVYPFYCGWNPEERITYVPNREQKVFQYCATKMNGILLALSQPYTQLQIPLNWVAVGQTYCKWNMSNATCYKPKIQKVASALHSRMSYVKWSES